MRASEFRHHSYMSQVAKASDLRLRRSTAMRSRSTGSPRMIDTQRKVDAWPAETDKNQGRRAKTSAVDRSTTTDPRARQAARRDRPDRDRDRARRPARARRAPAPRVAVSAVARRALAAQRRAPLRAARGAARSGQTSGRRAPRRWSAPPIVAPEPGARPFVEVGSQVKAGDTLLIIEAMKTMNQIPAPRAGTVIADPVRGRPAGRIRRTAGDHRMNAAHLRPS